MIWCARCGRRTHDFAGPQCQCPDPVFTSEPQHGAPPTLPPYRATQPPPRRPSSLIHPHLLAPGDPITIGGKAMRVVEVHQPDGQAFARIVCEDASRMRYIVPVLRTPQGLAEEASDIATHSMATINYALGPASGILERAREAVVRGLGERLDCTIQWEER